MARWVRDHFGFYQAERTNMKEIYEAEDFHINNCYTFDVGDIFASADIHYHLQLH
jgi:hypothetical protein